MSLRTRLQLNRYRLWAAFAALLTLCSCDEQRCSAPGECPAGLACKEGKCEEVIGQPRDAAPPPDALTPYDSGQTLDANAPAPRDVARHDNLTPPNRDSGSPNDLAPTITDTGVAGPPQAGDPCRMPNFDQGELDPCGINDPNLFCLETLDGQAAYCSITCINEEAGHPGHEGNDVPPHEHPPPCGGSGCCVLTNPGEDAGIPDWQRDRICRFSPDCG